MEIRDSVRIFAPATVANVACAFDILGFAVRQPGDEVRLARSAAPGVRIKRVTGDGGRLPLSAERNTAGVAVLELLRAAQSSAGIEIEVHKQMPLGSGLGSSAASAAAAVFGANLLLGSPFSLRELLPFAMEAERAACGTAHADNVAPALFGGFVLVRSYTPLDAVQLKPACALFCSIVHPLIELRTEDSRRILKTEVPLKDAVTQWGNIAGLIAGLLGGDTNLIGRSLQDVIFEPVRSFVIPGFASITQAALDAGALGCSLSGSGPSLFALSATEEVAIRAAEAMRGAFAAIRIEAQSYVSAVNYDGPLVME